MSPSKDGPSIQEEDFVLPLPVGGFWLPEVAPGTEIRGYVYDVQTGKLRPVA